MGTREPKSSRDQALATVHAACTVTSPTWRYSYNWSTLSSVQNRLSSVPQADEDLQHMTRIIQKQ